MTHIRRPIRLPAALLPLLLGAALWGTTPHGAVTGDVTYASAPTAQQTPVAGATVALTALRRTVRTDAQGRFALDAVPPGRYAVTVTQPRFPMPGTATVTVTESEPATLHLRMPQGHYLTVGIGAYVDADIERLVSPPTDARMMSAALLSALPGEAITLTERQATKHNMAAAMKRLAAAMGPQDLFVFYFSGHGGSDDSPFDDTARLEYLQPVESTSNGYDRDILDSELAYWLRRLPDPSRAVVILDSCYSGAFIRDPLLTAQPAKDDFQALARLGCTVLAAARYDEIAVDTDDGSLFTCALIDGLQHRAQIPDLDHNGVITLDEWFAYAAARTATAAQDFSERQHPQLLPGSMVKLFHF